MVSVAIHVKLIGVFHVLVGDALFVAFLFSRMFYFVILQKYLSLAIRTVSVSNTFLKLMASVKLQHPESTEDNSLTRSYQKN